MKQLFSVIITTILCFCVIQAQAVRVAGLYDAQIPVASQSKSQRNRALRYALGDVLVKASGQSALFHHANIKQALRRPINYVSEYDYASTHDAEQPYFLNVSFNQHAVNGLLTQSGLPVWSDNRPVTLIWLVVKDQFGLQLLGNDSTHSVIELLRKSAVRRGIPIVFPVLDIVALQQVSADDVWLLKLNELEQLSKRYAPNDILILRVDMTDEKNITSAWTFLLNEKKSNWQVTNNNLDQIIAQGVGQVASSLADQFTVKKAISQKRDITLVVSNVTDINQYAHILRYFRGLNGVINLEVLSVSSTQASFRLTIASSLDVLQRSIALDNLLKPIQKESLQDQKPTVLTYQYTNRS